MSHKTNKEFDQIFRDKLHQHEVMPPEHIWAGVQAAGLDSSAAKSSHWKYWAAASVFAFMLAVGGYFYFDTDINQTETIETSQKASQAEHQNIAVEQNTEEHIISESLEAINASQKQQISSTEQINLKAENKEVAELEEAFFEDAQDEQKIETEIAVVSEKEQRIILDEINTNTTQIAESTLIKQDELAKSNTNNKASKAGYDFFDDDAIDKMTAGHNDYKHWEFGIQFSPEWTTLPENDNNIRSYGIDLSATYHFSKWFAETGLGVSFSKDDVFANYQATESVYKGSYQDVYDVTFETIGDEVIPTYHTLKVDVFDINDTVVVAQDPNSYIYLNIPINIGWSTKLNEKFSFYAKGGLNNSFLIYKNMPIPELEGNIEIKEAISHNRTDWNMQAQVNLGINYHITNQFLFGLEPNARYYITSLVKDNKAGNPYGLGVKIGFKYIFK